MMSVGMRTGRGPLLAGAVLLSFCAAEASAGDELDFGKLSCEDFTTIIQELNSDEGAGILLWLDGYLSGITGDTVLDPKGMEKNSMRLVKYCLKNGSVKLLDATRRVGTTSSSK